MSVSNSVESLDFLSWSKFVRIGRKVANENPVESCRKKKRIAKNLGQNPHKNQPKKTWGYPHTPRLPLLGLCSCTCTARWERGECALIDKGNTPTRKVLIDIIFLVLQHDKKIMRYEVSMSAFFLF